MGYNKFDNTTLKSSFLWGVFSHENNITKIKKMTG